MRIALVAAVVAVVVASAAATSIGEANLWASNFGDQMVNLTETGKARVCPRFRERYMYRRSAFFYYSLPSLRDWSVLTRVAGPP